MKKAIKKLMKIFFIVVLIFMLIGFGYIGYKSSKHISFSRQRKNVLTSKNVRFVVREYYDDYMQNRTFFRKGKDVSMDINTYYYNSSEKKDSYSRIYASAEVKPYLQGNSLTIDYGEKKFWLVNSNIGIGLLYSSYPRISNIVNFYGEQEKLTDVFFDYISQIPDILNSKVYSGNDNGKQARIVDSPRYSYSYDTPEDEEYTLFRTYFTLDTNLPYKRTKVKIDGTEKLVSEYDIQFGVVTDDDVNLPNLTEFSQLYED